MIFGRVSFFAICGLSIVAGFTSPYRFQDVSSSFKKVCFSSGVLSFQRVSFIFFAFASVGLNELYLFCSVGLHSYMMYNIEPTE